MKRLNCFLMLLFCMACGDYSPKSADPSPGQPAPQNPPSTPGQDDDGDEAPTGDAVSEFRTVISPILTKSCAGANCHTSGSPRDALMKDSASFLRSNSLARINNGSMPTPSSSQAGAFRSSPDKQTLLSYLQRYKGK